MKILFVAPRFHSNQIDLVEKLLVEGHRVEFWVTFLGNSENYEFISPYLLPESNITRWLRNIKKSSIDYSIAALKFVPSIRTTYKKLKDNRPDVIILRGGFSFRYSYVIVPLCLLMNIKIIYYTQGPIYVQKISLARRLHDFFVTKFLGIKWFTPVLSKNYFQVNYIKLHYIEYIPFFMKSRSSNIIKSEDPLIIICVGKYERRKNLKLLLEVFIELKKMYVDIQLIIVGSSGNNTRDEHYNELTELINKYNLAASIELHKNVANSEMVKLYSKANLFVLPSINEPASVSQLEAMSYGLGVICSVDNGTASYIKNAINGYVIPIDFINLYQTIERYIIDPKLKVDHGINSFSLINGELSIETSYKKLYNIINS
jgi:glycosyltransferase involved in cell wall biosynthesis